MSEVDLNTLGTEVLNYINVIRTNPDWAINELQRLRKFYKNKEYCNPANSFHLLTDEGVVPLDEAIEFIQTNVKPLLPLNFSEGLFRSANKLVQHLNVSRSTKPILKEFDLETRIKMEIKEPGTIAENISFGWDDAKEIVLQLVIDDGVKNRCHRINLLGSQFDQIGVAVGLHSEYKWCCVIDMYAKRDESDANFEKYKMENEEWPENAISLEKKIEIKTEGNLRRVKLCYVFGFEGGKQENRVQEFVENG